MVLGGDGAIGRSCGETLRSGVVSSAAGVISLLCEGHDAVGVGTLGQITRWDGSVNFECCRAVCVRESVCGALSCRQVPI